MIKKKYWMFGWIVGLFLLGTVPVVWALERLPDGGFEAGIDGWTITNNGLEATMVQTVAPDPVRTGSGSARFNNADATPQSGVFTGVRLRECIDISSPAPTGSYFTFSGYIYVPSTNSNFDLFRARLRFYETSDCVTDVSSLMVPYDNLPTDEWTYFRVTGALPANADGVGLWLETAKTTNAASVVFFDDLRFYDSTPTAVSLQSFTAVSPIAWWWGGGLLLLGITAVLYHRRR